MMMSHLHTADHHQTLLHTKILLPQLAASLSINESLPSSQLPPSHQSLSTFDHNTTVLSRMLTLHLHNSDAVLPQLLNAFSMHLVLLTTTTSISSTGHLATKLPLVLSCLLYTSDA